MTLLLLEWIFTSIFLITVVLLLRALLGRRISAGLRYALWAVVLVRLLVPVQLFTSPIAGTWVITEREVTQNAADLPIMPTAPAAPGLGQPVISIAPGNVPAVPSPPSLPDAPEPPAAPDLTRLPVWLGRAWLTGSAAMAAVLLLSNLSFARRLRRQRIPLERPDCPLPVYEAVGLPSPCLFGVVRPAVYVTPDAAADPAMLRHVLAHECTHLRHGDHIWSLLRCAALAVHWWNPLVWLAVVLSRRDAELACDEGSLRELGEAERAGYGSTLLALVTAKPAPGDLLRCATTMTGDKKSLKERITRIARAPKRWLWAAVAAVLATALACACAFGQAAQEPVQEPAGKTELSFSLNENGDVSITGTVLGMALQSGTYWQPTGAPARALTMRYPSFSGGMEGIVWAYWEDENCQAVTINTSMMAAVSSYLASGYWVFTVDLSGENAVVTRMDAQTGTFPQGTQVRMYPESISDEEAVRAARIAARLLTEAENYYNGASVEIAFDHAGNTAYSSFLVPEEVLDAARAWVGRRFAQDASGGTMKLSWGEYNEETDRWDTVEDPDPDHAARFDRARINYMNGPWGYPQGKTDYTIWCINFEYHTTTPDKAENLLVGGRYLTEDDWFCPTYSNCTYLIFKDGKLVTTTLINDCSPYNASGRFYVEIARALGLDAAEPSDQEELLALFTADTEGVPEDVLQAVAAAVQEQYGQYYDYLRTSGSSVQFDGCRVQALNGPWRGAAHGMDLEVWQINYEFHTSTPQAAQDLLVGGNYLTDDNWLCPAYPNCTYVVFVENDVGTLGYLTDFTATNPSPEGDPGQFFDYVGLILAQRRLVDVGALTPDLDRDGAPEEIRLTTLDEGMGQKLELYENGKPLFEEEGYFAHAGYNALFLCTLDGEDYLLRYHPYMGQGWCTYEYQLFTLSPTGEERMVQENRVDFDINFQPELHQSFDIDAIAAFMDEINELLSHSVQLLNTDEDLLSTFEKEGQLADTLIWLDWWEPTYVPAHRDRWSLRAALQAFEQAMKTDRYNHALEVQAINEAGTDLRLTYKDKYTSFTGSWDYQFQGGVEPKIADLNQDGRDEIVVILYTPRHGAGVMIQELHVFDADTLEEYDCSSLTETLIGQVSSTGDQDNFYLTAPGAGLVALPKAMTSHPADAIHLGDYVEYHFQDNTLTCRLGCDMGMLEYCGEFRVRLTVDPATRKLTPGSFQYVSYYDTATGSLSGDQSRAYRQALLGEADLLLALGGEERTPVNIADVPALFDPDSGYARVGRFTVLDLDGAGVLEVVLRVDSVSGDMGGHVILHQENGQVLGLPMGHRSFSGLKTDGTFEYTDPTSVTSGGISSIRIKGGSYIIDDLAMWAAPAPGEEVDSYWVNHLEATEAQYRAVQAQQDIKPDAVWHDFTPENINTVFP